MAKNKQKTVQETDDPEKLEDRLLLKAHWAGRHKSVIQEMPEYDHIKLREDSSKIGNSDIEYPRERDQYRVKKYTGFSDGRSSAIYREFQISATEADSMTTAEIEELQEMLDYVRQLPELEERIREIDSFEKMLEKKELVRKYEAVYLTVQSIWQKDSLSDYNKCEAPAPLEFQHHPHGFYYVNRLHSEHLNELVGEKLESEDLGGSSQVWGAFFMSEPDTFNKVYNLLKPFYTTPTGNG